MNEGSAEAGAYSGGTSPAQQHALEQHSASQQRRGLVDSSRRGTWAYYRLIPEAIEPLRSAFGG